METLGIIIVIFIFMSMGILFIKLTLGINRNIKTGEKFRKKLKLRLDKLPITRMLDKRDIDLNRYLAKVPITDIEKQANNCSECSANKECEDVLSKEASSEADYSFCPNDGDFDQIKNTRMTSSNDETM